MDQLLADMPLRLTVCPRCEYSLAAHPPAGVCPECGRAYSTDEIVLYGYGAGAKRNARSMRLDSMRSLVLTGVVMLAAFVWLARSADRAAFMVYFAVGGYAYAMQIWRHFTEEGPGPVQVKLTPDGFRQGLRRAGPFPFERNDRAPLTPWRRDLEVNVRSLGDDRAQVEITPPKAWWKFSREYVNADVALDAVQVSALRARLAKWQSSAPR